MSKRGKAHARRRAIRVATCRLIGHAWYAWCSRYTPGLPYCTRCGHQDYRYFPYIGHLVPPLGIAFDFDHKPVTTPLKINPVDSTISLDSETGKAYSEYVSRQTGKARKATDNTGYNPLPSKHGD